ncbi:hypothetical protein LCM27_19855 [Ruegeria marisrubri]|uniref:hypothetical protein n=1 Tax=Ruegeria marisrubri TaxID=1685379 RepID=UPI001CD1D526|nr:hypothetical protein [Ruegeria marisrubri]MCA0908665.1 hypothetical protein [Ruegeria marisrubri]
MRRLALFITLAALIARQPTPAFPAAGTPCEPETVKGEIIVVLDDAKHAEATIARIKSIGHVRDVIAVANAPELGVLLVGVARGYEIKLTEQFNALPNVSAAEANSLGCFG